MPIISNKCEMDELGHVGSCTRLVMGLACENLGLSGEKIFLR